MVCVRWVSSLGLFLLVAGCLSPSNPSPGDGSVASPAHPFAAFTVPRPDFDFGTVVEADHAAHELPNLHTIGHGLKLAGRAGVGSILPPGMRGSISQIDVWQGYAVVAGFTDGPAFILLDLTDPAGPKPISYAPTVAHAWTVRFTEDGQYLFYGCQNFAPPNGDNGVLAGDCLDPSRVTGSLQRAPSGIAVYDVSDKTRPRFLDWVETVGSHNLAVAQIEGVDYVFTNAVDIVRFDRATSTLSVLGRIPGVHDAQVIRHPVTQDWLLYTGASNLGFAIYDVNDPQDPVAVLEPGDWNAGIGWHDQVAFPYLVDGRALLALAGEIYDSTGSLPPLPPLITRQGVPDKITLVDVTDPANPKKLSEWQPPFTADLPWTGYAFSAHEMAATPQGQLAVAWYHAGVWVLDVSTQERQAAPVVVAAYQPHEPVNVIPSVFRQTPIPLVPFTWSVAWDQRGYLVVPDMHTGVYVLEPAWGLRPLLDSGA